MITDEIKEFLNKRYINNYEIKDNQLYIGGDLNLGRLTTIPDGFNPTVGGNLYLGRLTTIPDGFNPTVGGNLYLGRLTTIPDGFNPTVGGYLNLESLTSIPDGFNPTVGGYLSLGRLTSIPDGFNPTVGGYLSLGRLTTIPDGFNPTVGGNLYLGHLTTIPDGFNPTVGGNLDLESLTSIPDGFNPTVGGNLYLRSDLKSKVQVNKPKENIREIIQNKIEPMLTWQDGKYRKIDGIFCEIISRKNNVIKVKTRNKLAYIFTKNNVYAHGKTVKQAYRDWLFKTSPRDMSLYENLKLNDLNELNYWAVCYRTITGACSLGTENFIEHTKLMPKMTLKEVLEVTRGQHGYRRFEEFFKEIKQ